MLDHLSGKEIAIFYSYALEDERLKDRLEKHLAILKHQRLIITWHHREIRAGCDWKSEIDTHLDATDIVLLLVSADFLASGYCYGIEMTKAMQKHVNGEAYVIPILLRPTDWSEAPFAK